MGRYCSAVDADYLIVGAGTAGCLLANRLSRHARVSLLEAGGNDAHPFVRVPIGYLKCIGHPRLDWGWSTEPEPGLNGRALRYPRGRVLGGCSSINGMIYMRGQARDYDAWARLCGDDAWSWRQVLPDFMAHEAHHAGAGEWHGGTGEWCVSPQRLHWPILDAVHEAARQLGLPALADFNRGDNEGVGYFEVNQRRGWRWNAAQAFLDPARSRIELHTGVLVERLLLAHSAERGWACVGVEGLENGQRRQWRARREVLLCAGAVASPLLMQRSGIGPPQLLQSLGIPVRIARAEVGGNLQDHLQLRSVWRVQGCFTLNTLSRRWRSSLAMGLDYLLRRRGPLSMAPSQLGLFMRSSVAAAHADLEFHVQPLSLPAFGQALDPFDAITLSVCHLNPSSRGSVQLRSTDARAAPLIRPNYLSSNEDCRVAALALRAVRRLAAQPALKRYQIEELRPGSALQTEADLIHAAGDIGTTIFHPVGTARMGSDAEAVLDARLRVRAVAGLRVVDASAMPLIPSGNTASPVLMMAEKAARFIAAEKAEPA
jgi:choline dehydrogenase